MIQKSTMKLLHNAIKEYDKLSGKDYLVACHISRKHPMEYLTLRINHHNFWHLLGCKIDKKQEKLPDIYQMCIEQQDITEYLNYTSAVFTCKEKFDVFMEVFNFVEKAKQIRISYTDDTPDFYKFKLANGNSKGIIGYDNEFGRKNIYIPKTTQRKIVASFNNQARRIVYICSRKIGESSFERLEYETAKGVYKEILKSRIECPPLS